MNDILVGDIICPKDPCLVCGLQVEKSCYNRHFEACFDMHAREGHSAENALSCVLCGELQSSPNALAEHFDECFDQHCPANMEYKCAEENYCLLCEAGPFTPHILEQHFNQCFDFHCPVESKKDLLKVPEKEDTPEEESEWHSEQYHPEKTVQFMPTKAHEPHSSHVVKNLMH